MRISLLAFTIALISLASFNQKEYSTCLTIAGSDSTIYNYIELPEEIMEVSKSADTPTVMHVHQQGDTLVLGFIPKNSQK
jgi:hypothetical protein